MGGKGKRSNTTPHAQKREGRYLGSSLETGSWARIFQTGKRTLQSIKLREAIITWVSIFERRQKEKKKTKDE